MWHKTADVLPSVRVYCVGFDEKQHLNLYEYDPVFGFMQCTERGLTRCLPPVLYCEVPPVDVEI